MYVRTRVRIFVPPGRLLFRASEEDAEESEAKLKGQ